jgi:hypothetical protein
MKRKRFSEEQITRFYANTMRGRRPPIWRAGMATRPQYEAPIRAGDAAAANNNGRDLTAMRSYLDGLLQIQIASIS